MSGVRVDPSPQTSPTTPSPIVVVDGVFFKLNNTGIARTWREILSRWQHSAWAQRVVVIDRDGSLPPFAGLRTIRRQMFAAQDWESDRKTVQAVCDDVGATLFISSYYTRPERTPSAMMVYDMIPEVRGFDLSEPHWRQKHDAIAHAVGYACNSHNTLADLHRLFPGSAAKPASVISRGVSAVFAPPSAEEIAEFRARMVVPHLADRRYVLFVGSPAARYKNGALLLEAFGTMSWISRRRYAVLFTTPDPMVAEFRSLPGLVAHAAPLSDAELRLAYAAAECLVYPSLYEGFGLPPLEAMACGCPVVCSGVASMPEVVGDAALLIDPSSARQLRAALRALRRPRLAELLRQRGFKRVKLFSWDSTAERLMALLVQCAKSLGGSGATQNASQESGS
jgi:glycosyltransferase involved in cell wall biosynthesis